MYRGFIECELGFVEVTASDEGIIGCSFVDEPQTEEINDLIVEAKSQLKDYFNGKRKDFDLPLILDGTDFQVACWKALIEIPYGETRSYQEQAISIGNQKAVRAVGGANNKNKIGIIVPCHRVIGKNGKMVGYAGGIHYKEYLLDLERRNTND